MQAGVNAFQGKKASHMHKKERTLAIAETDVKGGSGQEQGEMLQETRPRMTRSGGQTGRQEGWGKTGHKPD